MAAGPRTPRRDGANHFPRGCARIRCDERLRERRDISVVGSLRRDSVGRRELHVRTPCLDETHRRGESGLVDSECCLCLGKVVEDDRHVASQDVLLKCLHDGQASIDLNVPLLLCRNL